MTKLDVEFGLSTVPENVFKGVSIALCPEESPSTSATDCSKESS